jgi:tRNA pseudouridine32 synthase/23S rRNA pseudouridine746 synthase
MMATSANYPYFTPMPASIDDLFILPSCTEDLRLLQVDRDFLLVNKPTRLLSVPGRHPQNRDSVISRLLPDYPGAAIVHRLDFDTSGVMVIPLNKPALSHISKQFQARTVSKHYTAVVAGLMAQDEGVIDLPIASAEGPRYKVCLITGKPSLTEYKVLARDEVTGATRVLLHPVTGRSHQLRLHLQAIGHPILGCEFYGGDWAKVAPRLLLHATDLRFTDPATGAEIFIEVPPEF